MVEIIFQNKEDANKLFSKLKKQIPLCDNIQFTEEKHTIKINVGLLDEELQNQVMNVYYDFILTIKRDDWLRKMLTEQFCYEDLDEQQHILDIIYSIIDGENKEFMEKFDKKMEERIVKEAVKDLLQDTNIAFSFEAFS